MGSPEGPGFSEPLEPGDPPQIGSYRLLGRLGAGGMGQVYLGRSPGGRMVAVKVVHAFLAGDAEFRARFRREVQAARMVGGAFTAPVIDADADAAAPWLVTTFIAGPSLQRAVDERGSLPEATVLALAASLAEALAAIHGAGVVHRDLKPSNVLLAADGPRVIDFGIARAADTGTITRTGFVVGSPGFMSPEQVTGGEAGPASDVFSLGSVLAYAATGRGPFGEGLAHTQMYQVVYAAPDLDGITEPALRALITACLDKDPARRPAPGEILDRAVGQSGDGAFPANWLPTAPPESPAQPVSAAPPEPPEQPAAAVGLPGAHQPMAGTHQPTVLARAAPQPTHSRSVHRGPAHAQAQASPDAKVQGPNRRGLLIGGSLAAVAAAIAVPLAVYESHGSPAAPPPAPPASRLLATFTIPGGSAGIGPVAFSPDGRTVVGGDLFADTVYLADIATGRVSKTLPGPANSGGIDSVAFSPDGRMLVSSSGVTKVGNNATVLLWDVAAGKLHTDLTDVTGSAGSAKWLAFSPDDRILAIAGGAVALWNAKTLQAGPKVPGMAPVAFAPDGRTLASIGSNGANEVVLSSVAAGGISGTLPVVTEPAAGVSPDQASGVAFGADSAVLAVLIYTGSYGRVELWDTRTRSRIRSLSSIRTGEAAYSMAFSPDGQTIATVSAIQNDFTIRLWNAATGKPGPVLSGHTNSPNGVAFGPGGRTLVSGALDGTIRLWRVN